MVVLDRYLVTQLHTRMRPLSKAQGQGVKLITFVQIHINDYPYMPFPTTSWCKLPWSGVMALLAGLTKTNRSVRGEDRLEYCTLALQAGGLLWANSLLM